MLFNSFEFLVFFPVVTTLYFALPGRARPAMLLVASCWFYMAFIPAYILILATTILIDYWVGILLGKVEGDRLRRGVLCASLVANVGVLAVFKYYNFLGENIRQLAALIGTHWAVPVLGIALPVGLSFHTFQAMSYTIEVYRRRQEPERSPLIFALYVMFYPQLVAGPIERPQNLLHQFHEVHQFDGQKAVEGLEMMLWGMFKKVVVADRLAVIVNSVYDSPHQSPGQLLVIATYAFSLQIYCDFSGYSDIALGAARVMGIDLMRNFRTPYFSASISEFWSRWHISLSQWFRDYLYIPLGGNRVSRVRWRANLLIVFLVSGLWHGANWTYVIWGALHGTYLIVGTFIGPWKESIWESLGIQKYPRIRRVLEIFVTFNLVTFAWIFFRAQSLDTALYIIRHLTDWHGSLLQGLNPFNLIAVLAAIPILLMIENPKAATNPLDSFRARPTWLRWGVRYAVLFVILHLGEFTSTQFIYFQF